MTHPAAIPPTTRSLAPFVSAAGAISVLALDHRDALTNAYVRVGIRDVTEQTMLDAKQRIITALAPSASAILLDERAISLTRPAHLGLFMPLETQGHHQLGGGRVNALMKDFTPDKAAALGADGAKLLLYYRADHPASAEHQLRLTTAAAAACHEHGLALVVEPKVYRLTDEDEHAYGQRFGKLVVRAAEDLSQSGADLLKLQYPGTPELCRQITASAHDVPWTLLGGTIDSDIFEAQLRHACRAGASGFIAGRAIWGGALALDPEAQAAWLRDTAAPMFEGLCQITDTDARRIA